jgi:hypothetical protein
MLCIPLGKQDLPAFAEASARQAGLAEYLFWSFSGREWPNPIRLRRKS